MLVKIRRNLINNHYGRLLLKIYHYLYSIPISRVKLLKFYFFSKSNDYKKLQNVSFFQDDETFQLLRSGLSLSRFGDGEIGWIYQQSKGYFGQENSKQLSSRLKQVLIERNPNLLIGIPNFFGSMEGYSKNRKIGRNIHLAEYGSKWSNLLDTSKKYSDSLITRVYNGRLNVNPVDMFQSWQSVWQNKDVVIIEGEGTRFGVGNNLLQGVKSLRRIIAPSENAFITLDKILYVSKTYDKSVLFLIALGPTATILASELSKAGYQAIDVGHLDIEYEWFLQGKGKKDVRGKYVNEAGGMSLEELPAESLELYQLQIQYVCLENNENERI